MGGGGGGGECSRCSRAGHANEEVLRAAIKCCADEVISVLERDKPVSSREARSGAGDRNSLVADSAAISTVPVQQQQCSETKDVIVLRLLDILARALIVPIDQRVQFAEALYNNCISNERTLMDNVIGEDPVVDLVSDIGMNRGQRKVLIRFLATLQP